MSPCQTLLELSQRTARCGSVRKPAAYRVKPRTLECWRGWSQGTGRGAVRGFGPWQQEASRAVCTHREGPGQPGETPKAPWQGPSNSYFEGPCSMSACLPQLATRFTLPRRFSVDLSVDISVAVSVYVSVDSGRPACAFLRPARLSDAIRGHPSSGGGRTNAPWQVARPGIA